jgi:hypothetical protein
MLTPANDYCLGMKQLELTPGNELYDKIISCQKSIIDIQAENFSVAPLLSFLFCRAVVYLDHYERIQGWHEESMLFQNESFSPVYPDFSSCPKYRDYSLLAYKLSINGAIICNCITSETTHVISTGNRSMLWNQVLETLGRLHSKRFHVITKEWVNESITREGLANEHEYSIF